jgi:hypothetical protein
VARKWDVDSHKGTMHGFDCGPITGVVVPRNVSGSNHSKGEWLEPSLFALSLFARPMPPPYGPKDVEGDWLEPGDPGYDEPPVSEP